MSKQDFEFYSIEGLPGEFVRPLPQNDRHAGMVRLDAYTPEVPEGFAVLDPRQFVEPYQRGMNDPNGSFRFFFRANQQQHNTELVVRQHKEMLIPLNPEVVESIGYGTLALVGAIHDEFIARQREKLDRAKLASSKLPLATQDITSYGYVIGGEDEPRHPELEIADFTRATAYRWEPGPARGAKKELAPTYNPVPHSVLFLSTLSLKFINPLVPALQPAQ